MATTTTVTNSNRTGPQLVKILNHLKSGKDLTVAEARSRFGVKRLSARIFELRDLGIQVFTTRKTVRGGSRRGERVTAYSLGSRG